MVYRSKKDVWLVALVVAVILLPLALGIYNLVVPGGKAQAGWYLLFVGALVAAIVLCVTYPLYYEITPSLLVVRSGFMRKEIPLSTVDEIYPTKKPLSAPAWSLDRLKVNYRENEGISYALVSPHNKAEFMRDIAARVPGLEIRGERVVRTS